MHTKLLIDTGSTSSVLSKILPYKNFRNNILKENFNIQTRYNISFHGKIAVMPSFLIFKVNE